MSLPFLDSILFHEAMWLSLRQNHITLITTVCSKFLESEYIKPLILLYLDILSIQGLSRFHMNFGMYISIFAESSLGL